MESFQGPSHSLGWICEVGVTASVHLWEFIHRKLGKLPPSGVLQGHFVIPAQMEFCPGRNTMRNTQEIMWCSYFTPVFGTLSLIPGNFSPARRVHPKSEAVTFGIWLAEEVVCPSATAKQAKHSIGRQEIKRIQRHGDTQETGKSQNHIPAPLWHIQRCKDALTSLLPEHPSLWDWDTVNEAEQVAVQVPVPQVATLAGGSGKLN